MENKLKQETNELVDQLILKYTQSLREQIMQMLTESDKDKTQCLMAIDALKHDVYKDNKEQDERLKKEIIEAIEKKIKERDTTVKLETKSALDAHAKAMHELVRSQRVPWALIITVLLAVLSPIGWWLYTINQDLWAFRVEFGSFKSVVEMQLSSQARVDTHQAVHYPASSAFVIASPSNLIASEPQR